MLLVTSIFIFPQASPEHFSIIVKNHQDQDSARSSSPGRLLRPREHVREREGRARLVGLRLRVAAGRARGGGPAGEGVELKNGLNNE